MSASSSLGRTVLLAAQIIDETTSIAVPVQNCTFLTFYVKGAGTTSSGVVTLEEADWDAKKDAAYGGTWSSITTVNASDVSGGAQKAIHLSPGVFSFVRARISTAIGGGGSITVVLVTA